MFNIVLYNFNKRPNSLKKPTAQTTGQTIQCVMKSVSSVITPIIEISDPKLTNSIPLYNYAYIAAFNRYYFIEDVRFDIGVWTLWLRCDVLATYQDDILNSRQYVLRSASSYNPDLIDTLYNTFINSERNYSQEDYTSDSVNVMNKSTGEWVTYPYFNRSISGGGYCIGVIGNNTTGVTYYIMPANSFKSLLNNAFTTIPSDAGTDMSNFTKKTLANYLQYVTYCRWFPNLPISANLGPMVRNISFGGEEIPVTGTVDTFCYQVDTNMVDHFKITMTLPNHPQAGTYPYMALSPYSEYSLYFQPFGVIPLDSSKIYDCSSVEVHWFVDYCTGSCDLQIRAVNSDLDDYPLVYTESTEIGVNLPVSNMIMDWKVGLGMAGLSFIKSIAPNDYASRAMTGGVIKWQPNDVEKSIQSAPAQNVSLIDTVMNTLGTTMGQIATKGSSGSFLAYNMGKPFIFAYFMEQTAHMPELFGQPCCKSLRLDNISGFCLCENATVTYVAGNPTVDEQNVVISMLNSGVYIE